MYPHRIRLRGPWEWETDSGRGSLTLPGVLPAAGRLVLRRLFGWPARIDAHERVWLILANLPSAAAVVVNGEELGMAQDWDELNVTMLLRPRNVLLLTLEVPLTQSSIGDVQLEVRCTAWLRGVEVRADATTCTVTGEVAGTAERPLDVYLLVGRVTAAFASVGAGERFELRAPPTEKELHLELVNGGVVWYAVDLTAQSGASRGTTVNPSA